MKDISMNPGYVLMPYKIINTKVTVSDKNGTKSYWLINPWERLKLFIRGLFHKKTKI